MDETYMVYVDNYDTATCKNVLRTMLMASEAMRRDYGSYAAIASFGGPIGHALYDEFARRKYDVGAQLVKDESGVNRIVLELGREVQLTQPGVVNEFGFIYSIERSVNPTLTIMILT